MVAGNAGGVPLAVATTTLGNVGGHREGGAAQLDREPETLVYGEGLRVPLHL